MPEEGKERRQRRTSDDLVADLYERMVGTLEARGFIYFVEDELRGIRLWQESHATEHQKRDEEAKVVRRDIWQTTLRVGEKALLALFSAVLAFVTYLGLAGGQKPGPQ